MFLSQAQENPTGHAVLANWPHAVCPTSEWMTCCTGVVEHNLCRRDGPFPALDNFHEFALE